MKVFLAGVCAALLLATAAGLLLDHEVQRSAGSAFATPSARI